MHYLPNNHKNKKARGGAAPAGFFLSELDNFIFLFCKVDKVDRLVFCACKRIFRCWHIWYNYVSSVFNILVTNESAAARPFRSPSISGFKIEIISFPHTSDASGFSQSLGCVILDNNFFSTEFVTIMKKVLM